MKFLYIADIRLPTEKAHGVQISKMCEAFAQEGNEVILAVSNRPTPISDDPFSYYGVRKDFTIRRVPSLNTVRFGPLGYHLQSLSFAFFGSLTVWMVRPHVVYTRDPLLVIIASLLGVPAVFWEAHTASERWVARVAARRATTIVPISQGLANFLIAHGAPEEKIVVEHDGVDLAEYARVASKQELRERYNLPADCTIVEYVGKLKTMGHPKGVEEIIQAVGAALNNNPASRLNPTLLLLLVGLNSDEIESAIDLAEEAGLSNYKFVAHVQRTLVPDYLAAADILVMNYPNTPHYANIMSPLKLFEYMASGVPIISSDLPSLREVLSDDTAFFIPPDNIIALEQGIVALAQDPVRAARIGAAAKVKVTEYTWQARAARLTALMQIATKNNVMPFVPKIVRYIISGVTAAVVNVGTLYVLASLAHIWYLAASVAGFILSFFVSFFLQRTWTFEHRSGHRLVQHMSLYLVTLLINLAVNTFIVYMLVECIRCPYLWAQLIAGLLIAFGSYFVYQYAIFTKPKV